MSHRNDDDEVYDEDDYDDEDDYEEDDDEEVDSRKGSANPFSSAPRQTFSSPSNLPGRDRTSFDRNAPAGGRDSGARPGGTNQPGGGGSFSRNDLSSRLGGGTPASSSSPFSRDPRSSGGDLRSGFDSGDRGGDKKPAVSSPSGGGQRPTAKPFGGDRPDDSKGGGGFGSRFGSGQKEGEKRSTSEVKGTGGGSRFGGGQKEDDRGGGSKPASGGGGGSRFGGGQKEEDRGGSKPASGGGFSSRFSGGGQKEEDRGGGSKPASGGGFGSRLGLGKKGDDKGDKSKSSSGGGGFGSRLGLGKKGDDKGGSKPASGGGYDSRFGSSQKDSGKGGSKPASGGGIGSRLGGFGARFGRGKKEDDRSAGAASAPGRSTFGASGQSAAQPQPSTKQSAFRREKGGAGAPAKSRSKAQTSEKTGLLGRFSLPFGGAKQEKVARAKQPRTSKVPRVQGEGLTTDNKLDILGVSLVFGSMVLFFSSLSPDQGSLTGGISNFFGQLLGWGALAFPVAMLAVGVWLIVRVFGENAPTVDPVRIWGVVMGYIGILVLFQYLDSFSYSGVTDLKGLEFWLNASREAHSGGGLVGARLYYLLVANVTEIGGFFVLVGWLVISVMFMARLSASELAVIIISAWRSFRTAQERRAVRRRAAEVQRTTARPLAAETPQISVSKPAPAELPIGVAAALPSPASRPIEERNIPITMGGRTVTATFGGDQEKVEVEAETSAQPAAPSGGRFGGFGARLRSAVPVLGSGDKSSETAQPASQPAAQSKTGLPEEQKEPAETSRLGGIRKGLFGRGKSAPEAEPTAKPAGVPAVAQTAVPQSGLQQPAAARPAAQQLQSQPVSQSASAAASPFRAAPSSPFGQPGSPAKSPAGSPTDEPVKEEEQAARLGDLLRPAQSKPSPASSMPAAASPAAPGSRVPFGRPPGTGATPPEKSTAEERPAASAFSSPFRKPDDAATGAKPLATDKPAAFKSTASEVILPPTMGKDESPEDAMDSLDARLGPAKPKGTGPAPRPQSDSPFKIGVMGQSRAVKDDDEEEFDDDEFDDEEEFDDDVAFNDEDELEEEVDDVKPAAAASSLSDRLNRLNALREGKLDRPEPPKTVMSGGVTAYPSDTRKATEPQIKLPQEPKPAQPAAASVSEHIRPFGGGSSADKPVSPFSKPDSAFGDGKKDEKPAFTQSPASAPFGKPGAASSAAIPFDKPGTSSPAAAPFDKPTASSLPATGPLRPPSSPPPRRQQNWKLPDFHTLLAVGSDQDFDRSFLVERARTIEETLQSFGAPGRVVEINTGPVITQFGVEPDYLLGRSGKKNRVKVSAIAQLDKDMQLALGAKTIRVEAPVPGKGFVGIEVPNDAASLVSLRDVMESEEFNKINSPLTIALGQSVDGTPVAADLGVMPHLLIAGTTGSGKSVCVNSIIASLLVRNTPDKLKMIMVDPKRVELTSYNGLPHLVAPVVVELERIVGVLKWVTREMDERYKRFSNAGARNIEDFNKHLPLGEEWMPYIIVFIDELADLMMLAPDETERVVTRIAALARATGIHLVIATQRPSVDVVTGLIKANFPARIAFAVASSVDSRVILDQPGADRLLGRGDMLYMSGDSPAPVRLQGVFVSDVEINNIVHYWKSQDSGDSRPTPTMILDKSSPPMRAASATPSSAPGVSSPKPTQQAAFWDRDGAPAASTTGDESDDGADGQEDEMYEEAVELVRRLNKASVSLLQRRLRIGYTRAARLIDIMEERGVVGPAESGSKPREVLPEAD